MAAESTPTSGVVTIHEAEFFVDGKVIQHAHLDLPKAGSSEATYSILLSGWVIGVAEKPEAVELSAHRGDMIRLRVDYPRPDVADKYPEVPYAAQAGFRGQIGAAHLPQRFELSAHACFSDGSRTPLGIIRGERRALPRQPAASRQPVLVTTMGRSGSTWLTWVLGHHPNLIAFKPFSYEARVTGYFGEALAALAQPSSYLQTVSGDVHGTDWWLGKERARQGFPLHEGFERWMGTVYVEELSELLMGRIDAIYERIAEFEDKPGASFFVEKHLPLSYVQEMIWDVFSGTREVFLVRDLRDLACSALAFWAQPGRTGFGREWVSTDEEFVRGPLRLQAEGLLRAWQRRTDSALLRYEDLIRAPEETLVAVLSYIGVDHSPEIVHRMLLEAPPLEAQAVLRTTSSAESSIGRWKSDLSPELQSACEEALGDLLDAFGYQT